MVVVVATHNLALGVFVGVLLASLFFANKIGKYMAVFKTLDESGLSGTYRVVGQVFFASSEQLVAAFDFREALEQVTIDLSEAHFWDITSVSALDRIVIRFRREGTRVTLIGMNEASATVVDKFGIHNKPEAVEKMLAGGH